MIDADGVLDGLFHGELAVSVHVRLVLGTVGEASGAAYAAAHACHALDEVAVCLAHVGFEQSDVALFDAVAGHALDLEIEVLFFERLGDRVGQTAATREDASEVGRVVQHAFAQLGDVDVAAVKERLELLERDDAVDVRAHVFEPELHLLGRARSDKDDLAFGVGRLDVFGYGRGGGEVVRHVARELGIAFLHEADERGAAGTGQEALFGELLGLVVRHHVRAESGLHCVVEPEFFDARYDLAQLGVSELAGDAGRHDGIDLVRGVAVRLFEHVDDVQNEGLVGDRAEGALIDARAAGDAFVV